MSTHPRVKSLYTVELRKTLTLGDLHHLNWGLLVDVWPDLRIPDSICDMWKVTFAELAGNPGLWGSRQGS